MKRMYCPWRSNYTTQEARIKKENLPSDECIFCDQFAQNIDKKFFILKRFKHNVVMLNRFPYNTGHLLIIPFAHKATLNDLSKAARSELMELITQSSDIVQKQLKADGVNIGLNVGKASGSSIPSHLHFHILPRWYGDTNFLPTLADTKQISVDLNDTYKKLKKAFDLM